MRQSVRYLGVSRREFSANWQPYLPRLVAGTRKLYDVLDLNALFESKKQRTSDIYVEQRARGAPTATRGSALPTDLLNVMNRCAQISRRRRPTSSSKVPKS